MPFFEGLYTAMVTPFDRELRVDLEGAERLADHLMRNGSGGLVVSGTTGESPTLTAEEKVELFRTVKRVAEGRAQVIAGTGTYSTVESIELTRKAEAAGADGVMLVVPYYNKPPQEGLYRHFRAIAEATSLPVVLYNVPSRTACNLDAATVIRLSEVRNILGVKEASGDFGAVSKIVSETGDDFAVLSGQDEWNLPLLSLGATGFISVASHVVGRELREMLDHYSAGRSEEALALHHRLLQLFKVLFLTTNPIMVKAAVNLLGVRVGGLRPPLIEATAEQIEPLRRTLEGLELLAPAAARAQVSLSLEIER